MFMSVLPAYLHITGYMLVAHGTRIDLQVPQNGSYSGLGAPTCVRENHQVFATAYHLSNCHSLIFVTIQKCMEGVKQETGNFC